MVGTLHHDLIWLTQRRHDQIEDKASRAPRLHSAAVFIAPYVYAYLIAGPQVS